MTLTISPDSLGALHYSIDHIFRGGPFSGRVKVSPGAVLTQPFIFYWDAGSNILWQATATEVVKHSPKDGTTFYDNTPKTLERTPEAFRKEAEHLFNSK